VPYCLRVTEMQEDLLKLISRIRLSSPRARSLPTLDTLARFSLMSPRLAQARELVRCCKMLVYDAKSLKDPTLNARTFMNTRSAASMKHDGVSTRFASRFGRKPTHDPTELGSRSRPSECTTPSCNPPRAASHESKKRYLEFIQGDSCTVDRRIHRPRIQKAYPKSYSITARTCSNRYVDYADAWIEDQESGTGSRQMSSATFCHELYQESSKPAGNRQPLS